MQTLLTRSPADAAGVLARSGLCALPTETVYGLAARADDADAVAAVFRAKGRPADNPLIVHLGDVAQARHVAEVGDLGRALLAAFAPGPLTVVLPARSGLVSAITAGLDTVAVRVPGAATAREVIGRLGVPVVAPSANRSGRPSPTTWQAVEEDLGGRIDAILQGSPTDVGLESTVVDATGTAPIVLRPGAVTLDDLRRVFPSARPVSEGDVAARSPGTRHRHYAPRARVRLIESVADAVPSPRAAWIGTGPPPDGYGLVTVCAGPSDYARRLFDAFRRADAAGLTRIDALAVPDDGIGAAVMDRLRRAAAR